MNKLIVVLTLATILFTGVNLVSAKEGNANVLHTSTSEEIETGKVQLTPDQGYLDLQKTFAYKGGSMIIVGYTVANNGNYGFIKTRYDFTHKEIKLATTKINSYNLGTVKSVTKDDKGYNYFWVETPPVKKIPSQKLKNFPLKEFTDRLNQAWGSQLNVQLENNVLKISPVPDAVGPSEAAYRVVNSTLNYFGYMILQYQGQRDQQSEGNDCYGTEVYIIGEIQK